MKMRKNCSVRLDNKPAGSYTFDRNFITLKRSDLKQSDFKVK